MRGQETRAQRDPDPIISLDRNNLKGIWLHHQRLDDFGVESGNFGQTLLNELLLLGFEFCGGNDFMDPTGDPSQHNPPEDGIVMESVFVLDRRANAIHLIGDRACGEYCGRQIHASRQLFGSLFSNLLASHANFVIASR